MIGAVYSDLGNIKARITALANILREFAGWTDKPRRSGHGQIYQKPHPGDLPVMFAQQGN
jgi:hypothetical protein